MFNFITKQNLKKKMIFAFSFASIFIILSLSFFSIEKSQEALKKEIELNYQTQALNTIQKIDMSLFERYGDAQAFALSELAIRKIQGEQVDAQLQSFMDKITVAYGFYDLMLLVDRNGNVLKTNLVQSDGSMLSEATVFIGKNMSNKEWFKKCISGEISNGTSYYSDPYFDEEVTNLYKKSEPIINFAAPVFDNGKIIGVWCNFTNASRAIGNVTRTSIENNKSKGVKSFQIVIIDKNQRLLDDVEKPYDVLKYNFQNSMNSVNYATKGIDSFLIENDSRTGKSQVIGFAQSKGSSAYKGNGWVCLAKVSADEALTPVKSLVNFLLFLGIILILIIVILTFFIANYIIKEINNFSKIIENLADDVLKGKLNIRANPNEVGIDFQNLVKNTNHLIDAFVEPIVFTSEYLNKISVGEMPPKIIKEFHGDFNQIKNNLNQLIESTQEVTLLINEISHGNLEISITPRSEQDDLVKSIIKTVQTLNIFIEDMNEMAYQHNLGDIDIMMNVNNYSGSYLSMAEGVNKMVASHIDVKKRAMAVVAEYGIGNFDANLEQLPGKKAFINTILNEVKFNLKSLDGEIEKLIISAKEGKLDYRGNSNQYKGDWKKIVTEINELIDVFVKPIQTTSYYINRISDGDIPSIIEEHYKGDFNIVKDSINKLILSSIQIINLTNSVAKGDLTIEMSLRSNKDDLVIALNKMVESMRIVINEVIESVHNTSATAQQLASNAETMSAAAQEQSSQTEEVASAVEEMARTITQNSMSTSLTSDVANENGKIAEIGGKVVEETILKMKEIAKVVKSSADNIQKLGDSSKEIGEIVSVIDDIADQTNLLALNAAIEAARAGEQGRGFAVVADEVRKLAERTTEATKQIASMIKNIQRETDLAVNEMEKGNTEVQFGISLADKAGESLNEILKSSKQVFDMVSQIAIANEQQSTTSEEISRNVLVMSQVIGESAKQITEVAEFAAVLTEQTKGLTGLMEQFQVNKQLVESSELNLKKNKMLSSSKNYQDLGNSYFNR